MSHCSLFSVFYLYFCSIIQIHVLFQLNEEGKFDVDKGIELLKEMVKNNDDYKALETIVKSCASG